jgi:hypothetical protein
MDPGGWILFLMLGKEGGKCDANIHPSPYERVHKINSLSSILERP